MAAPKKSKAPLVIAGGVVILALLLPFAFAGAKTPSAPKPEPPKPTPPKPNDGGGNGDGDGNGEDNKVPSCGAITAYTADDVVEVLGWFDQLVGDLKKQQQPIPFSGYPELGDKPIPQFPGESWKGYVTRVGMLVALARAKLPLNFDDELGCILNHESDLGQLYAALYDTLWGEFPW